MVTTHRGGLLVEPRVAVILPAYRPDARHLHHAIMSVRQQTEGSWQLVVVDDASGEQLLAGLRALTELDSRTVAVVLPENRGISGASNTALEHVTAPWIALLDHDDFLEPDALELVLRAAEENPDAEVIYTDRDAVDAHNIPTEFFAKPDWSPERLRGNMYIAHLTVLRTDAVRAVGGFRSAFDGAQDHDLVLRVTERGAPVVHVPRIAYHWRQLPQSTALDPGAKPYAAERGLLAVQEHLDRCAIAGTARHTPYAGFYFIDRHPRSTTSASIVIPTRGGTREVPSPGSGTGTFETRILAVDAVSSIVAHDYEVDYEIVVVHDTHADPAYLEDLRELAGDRLKVVDFDGPFNFSAKVNLGVSQAQGDVVVLLNDDVEVITPRWLDQLVALAEQDDVGAVGAKLLFEDGTIQHAGHVFADGQIQHAAAGELDGPGQFGANLIDREVVGVTAACLAQRKSVWEHLGGMDEALPNNFNDVDYCARIRAKGYRIVQANSVVLHHFESRTRTPRVAWWEAWRIIGRLGSQLDAPDPYTPKAIEPLEGEEEDIRRDLREWVRVTRAVLSTEGVGPLMRKARRRVTGRRVAADAEVTGEGTA